MKIFLASDTDIFKGAADLVGKELSGTVSCIKTGGAVAAVKEERPDVVVLDGAAGLLPRLKAAGEEVSVLVCLDPDDRALLQEAVQKGADSIIFKPVDEGELTARIEIACRAREKISALRRTERRLKEERDHFRALLDFTPDWEYLLDPEGNFTYVSSACEDLTGYSPEEFLEDPGLLERITHPDDLPLLQEHLRLSLDGSIKEALSVEFRIITRGGEERWLSHLCRPLVNTKGAFQGKRSSNRDITRQKELETALKQREAKYRFESELVEVILNGTPDIIGLQKPDHQIIRYNRAGYQFFGLTAGEVKGKKCYQLLGRTEPCEVCATAQAVQSKKSAPVEKYIPEKGLYIECRSHPILDEDGVVTVVVEQMRDITENRKMTDALKESEAALRRITDNMQDLISETDKTGVFRYVSPSHYQVLGYAPEELLGKHAFDFIHPEEVMAASSAFSESIKQALLGKAELRYRHADGRYIWMETLGKVLQDESGEVVGGIFSSRDISKRKQAEEELKKVHAGLEQMVRERTAELERLNQTLQADIEKRRQVEEALRESETRYRTLIENIPTGIYRSTPDPGGRILVANPAFRKIFSIESEEALKTFKVVDFYRDPDDRRAFLEQLRREGAVQGVELKLKKMDGTPIWGSVTATVIRDGRGNPAYFDCTIEDITWRKEAEAELVARDALLKKLSERVPGAIYQYRHYPDGRSCLPYASEGIRQVFEVAPEEVREDAARLCERVHPDDSEAFKQSILDSFHTLEPWEHSFRVLLPESGERWLSGRAVPEKLDDGSVLWHGFVSDITAHKLNVEEIQTRNEELITLNALSIHMRKAVNASDLLPIVMDKACSLLKADDGTVALFSADRKRFTVAYGDGNWTDSVGLAFPATEGLSGLVLRTGETYVSANYSADPKALSFDRAGAIGPMVVVPMLSDNEIIGTLAVSRNLSDTSPPFTPSEVRLLETVGEMACNALRRQRSFEEARRRLRLTQALRNIDMAITGSLDLRITYNIILDEVTGQLNVDAAAILRLEPHSMTLRYEAWRGFFAANPAGLFLRPGEGYAGRAALTNQTCFVLDLKRVEPDPAQGTIFTSEGFITYYAVPLVAKGRVQGVLEVFHRHRLEADEEWNSFLDTLAGQTAIAIDNASLFQNLERANIELMQSYDATIEGWAYALDLRDEVTEGHSRRVAEMTRELAREMEVKDEDLAYIRRGALLHDIGKMGIPDAILLKPGKLTEEEWAIMRRHPDYAYKMLSSIEYLRRALDIPYCHHERWDGSGYPRGLKGKEIPLSARIFAVVDTYDALTSERPYRKAWPREKALEYIRAQSGLHFDPQVVEMFMQKPASKW